MLIILDNSRPEPLYQQIVDQIRAKILAGTLKPGDPLPSIRQLAADLLTSVITTKRSYQELEAEGLIEARPGRGSQVAQLTTSARERLRQDKVEERLREAVARGAELGLTRSEMRDLLDRTMTTEGLRDD